MLQAIGKAIAVSNMDSFKEINQKVDLKHAKIEELAAVRDFMTGVPNEIEKLRGEIKIGMQYYGILEEFCYTFGDSEFVCELING